MVNFSNQFEVCKICFEIPIANCIVEKDINFKKFMHNTYLSTWNSEPTARHPKNATVYALLLFTRVRKYSL